MDATTQPPGRPRPGELAQNPTPRHDDAPTGEAGARGSLDNQAIEQACDERAHDTAARPAVHPSSTTDAGHLAAALTYAVAGVPVFPCRSPDKKPITANGFKDAVTDPKQINTWWTARPTSLIGRPTGAASGVVVLDVDMDAAEGKDGEASLAALIAQHGPLPDTWEAMTPRGGRHIYFRHPAGTIRNSASKIGPDLDIRGDGGYVIAPPSTLPDGRSYQWEASSDPEGGATLADLPPWLAVLIASPDRPHGPATAAADGARIGSGSRNDTLFRLGRSLRAKGLTHDGILAALRAENAGRCDPPLPDAEVCTLAASAARPAPGHSTAFDAGREPSTGAEGDPGPSSAHCADSAPKEPAPWADLVPLATPKLPRLDAGNLPTWAGTYAAALASATETPPELPIGMILAAAAVPCARRLRVLVAPGHFEPCNLWLAVALPPGNRKSAVQSAACAPLVTWEREAVAAIAPEIRNWESETKTLQAQANASRAASARATDRTKREASAQEAADLEAKIQEAPVSPQLWTSDATPERLGAMLADQNECMAWLSSEAGLFDLLAGRYSKGIPNLDLVLKAWSGDAERVDRGSRPPVYLASPRLTIGLSPQPDVLRGLSNNPGFRGRGLLGRFAYLLPPSPLGYRDLSADRPGARVPESVETAYREGIRAMLDWPAALDPNGAELPRLIRLEPAAYAEWLDFARMVEARMKPGADLEGVTDLAGKVPGGAARIAGVLHGIEHAHGKPWEAPVSLATMGRALTLAAAMLRHSAAALDMMGADESIAGARRVWEWLERGRRANSTVREAFNALRGSFPRMLGLNLALEALTERGYVRVVEPVKSGPGRPPSPRIEVRPEFVEAWR